MNQTLTALDGVKVGHASNADHLTGVTVVVFDRDLPIATCCYGGSPGTFNTDAFDASRGNLRAEPATSRVTVSFTEARVVKSRNKPLAVLQSATPLTALVSQKRRTFDRPH